MRKYMLIHVPHANLFIPKEYKRTALISEDALEEENLFMCDYLVDQMIDDRDKMIVFPYSRLYCDVERFWSEEEVMNKYGMGVMYTKTSLGDEMFKINLEHKKQIFAIYKEYHEMFDLKVTNILQEYGKCLIIDLHSYSSSLVERLFGYRDLPDICIGIEDKYYSEELTNYLVNYFEGAGYSVRINYPYTGSLVPNKYYGKNNTGIVSIMIEINKRVYENDWENFKRILNKGLEF